MPPAPQGFDPSSPSLPFEFAHVPHRSSANILNFCVPTTNFEVNFPMSASRGMSLYLNLGHALDHLLMLVFPTVVLAMGEELGGGYAELLPLSLGGFIAFGAGSVPAGWLADRWSRFGMMGVFFFGIGAASILTGFATGPVQIASGLTLIGVFAAIYHPVGIAMLVAGRDDVGRVLGVNGVFGNVGVAFSALIAGALADTAGWRAAFIVPGAIALAVGAAFAFFARESPGRTPTRKTGPYRIPRADLARVFAVRYVVSFTASALAVPLVAWLYRSSGDFRLLYFALGALALATFAAALFFPAEEGKTAAGELAA